MGRQLGGRGRGGQIAVAHADAPRAASDQKHIQELTEDHFEQRHVDDKNDVIDFYGKYVLGKKAAQSVMYLSNRQMQAPARG